MSKSRPRRGSGGGAAPRERATWSGSRHVRSVINNRLRIVVRPGGCVGRFRLSWSRHACLGLAQVLSEAKKVEFSSQHTLSSLRQLVVLEKHMGKNHVGTRGMVRQEVLFKIFFWNTTVLRPISLCILLPRWEQDEILLGSWGGAATLLRSNVSSKQHKQNPARSSTVQV